MNLSHLAKDAHLMRIAPYWLFAAREVCIPLHGCSDRYFLSVSKNEAQIPFTCYTHLLCRAEPFH